MSTIYKHLIDDDIQNRTGSGVFLETERTRDLKFQGVRIAVLVLFAASALAFFGSWMIYHKWNSEKELNRKLEAEQIQLRDRVRSFDHELANLQSEIAGLRGKLAVSEDGAKQLKAQLSSQSSDVTSYQREIAGLRAEKSVLEKKIRALEETPAAATPAVTSSEPEVSGVSAPVNSSAIGKPSKILTVNRRFNFVVINLGSKDRLRVGDRLSVEKDGQKTGVLEVEKTYDHFSAATIIEESRGMPFQEGNSVRRL